MLLDFTADLLPVTAVTPMLLGFVSCHGNGMIVQEEECIDWCGMQCALHNATRPPCVWC